jgi:hypothetical protein
VLLSGSTESRNRPHGRPPSSSSRDVGRVVTRLHAASEALPGGPTSLQSGSNWRTLGVPIQSLQCAQRVAAARSHNRA